MFNHARSQQVTERFQWSLLLSSARCQSHPKNHKHWQPSQRHQKFGLSHRIKVKIVEATETDKVQRAVCWRQCFQSCGPKAATACQVNEKGLEDKVVSTTQRMFGSKESHWHKIKMWSSNQCTEHCHSSRATHEYEGNGIEATLQQSTNTNV